MAQQKGIIPLQGTIGNLTFFKSQDGYMAREKGGVSAKRIATDPAYERTRENGAEFSRAGKASKLLRASLRGLLFNTADSRMIARLVKTMNKVIKADSTSARGLRNVIDGEVTLLLNFEFNVNGQLNSSFYAPYESTIDRVAGSLTARVPSFVPVNMVAAPNGATHLRIVSAGVEIDFEKEVYVVQTSASPMIPWSNDPTAEINLVNAVTPASTKPLFLALGIEFYQVINGTQYALKSGAFNALSLVSVSGE